MCLPRCTNGLFLPVTNQSSSNLKPHILLTYQSLVFDHNTNTSLQKRTNFTLVQIQTVHGHLSVRSQQMMPILDKHSKRHSMKSQVNIFVTKPHNPMERSS